jgi:hypothetical protein
MRLPRRSIAVAVITTLLLETSALALDADKGAYVGGTHGPYLTLKDPIEGHLNTQLEDALVLSPEKKPYAGQELRIPYRSIIDLEYGQKAGRRVGLAAGLAVISVVGVLALFSKKRKHYLTIGYTDDAGKEQVAVLELGKDRVRTTLAIVETRSGKSIEYQDEEAKKNAKG